MNGLSTSPMAGSNSVSPVPQSEVQSELNMLDMNVGDIENAFEAIASKLDPIRSHNPIQVSPDVAGKSPERNSPLGQTLNCYNQRLSILIAAVHGMRNDLHI